MKSFTYLFFPLLLCFGLITETRSQTTYSSQGYIPPSPLAAAMKVYGDIPVSYSTGVPNISIPIYTVQQDGYELPIVLRYHVKSIKPASCKTNVALGWTLDYGGMVSRSIYSKPDQSSPQVYTYNTSVPCGSATNQDLFDMNKPNGSNTEYDIYSYSIPGGSSGEFIMADGVKQMSRKPVKIHSGAPGGAGSFDITDENGVIFKYGYGNVHFFYSNYYSAASSWQLSQIALPSGRNIDYTYETIARYRENTYKLSYFINGDNQYRVSLGSDFGGGSGFPPDIPNHGFSNSGPGTEYDELNIKEITFANGKVVFDLSADKKLITGVKVYNLERLLYEYQFVLSSSAAMGEMKLLNKVVVKDATANTVNEYELTYFGGSFVSANAGTDYWGYYNGWSQLSVPCGTYPYRGYQPWGNTLDSFTVSSNCNPKEANLFYSMVHSLTSIKYPTGGETEFIYGLNQLNSTVYGDGLRIEKIKNRDAMGNTYTRTYSYNPPVNALVPSGIKQFANFSFTVGTAYDYINSSRFLVVLRNRTYEPDVVSRMANFLLVCRYDTVTEVIKDGTETVDIGKNVYYYKHNKHDASFLYGLGYSTTEGPDFGVLNYKNWDNDLLIKKETFRKNETTPFQTTISNYQYRYDPAPYWNTYVTALTDYYQWPTGGEKYLTRERLIQTYPAYLNLTDLPHAFAYANYTIATGWVELTSQTQTEVTGSSTLTTLTEYEYNGAQKFFPSRIITHNSDGTVNTTDRQYPYDLAATAPYTNMVAKNIVAPLITETKYKGTGPSAVKLETKKTNYSELFSGLIKPLNVQASVYNNPLENRLDYQSYDQYGNIMQLTKTSDAPTVYIWGYNKTLPIAEVTNAVNNETAYSGFEGGYNAEKWLLPSGWTATPAADAPTGKNCLAFHLLSGSLTANVNLVGSKTYIFTCWEKGAPISGIGGPGMQIVSNEVIRTAGDWRFRKIVFKNVTGPMMVLGGTSGNCYLDDLCVYPADGSMSTYTYDPLVGMTSKTEVNGAITRYEYDSFNRLKLIRDQDNNIIKQYDYKYKVAP